MSASAVRITVEIHKNPAWVRTTGSDLLVNKYCTKIIKMLQLLEHFAVSHQLVTFTPSQKNCYNTGEVEEDLDVTAFETHFVNENAVCEVT